MGGGQATNSGIDYQQRISAWFLINQYSNFDISVYFDQLEEELIINKTHFETGQNIDDLNLTCNNDPLFDNNFQLVSGYPIMDINKEIEKKKNESDE